VERIEQQQIANDWILAKSVDHHLARCARLEKKLHDPFQPRAMDLHEKLYEFPDRRLGTAAGHLVEFAD
jgi:hypothetical protein